jgi:hypothetical protein
MAGQLTQYGAEWLGNAIGGNTSPYFSTSTAPSTWFVGQPWINSSTTLKVYDPHTTAWVTGPYQLYMALLAGNPLTSGPGGGVAVDISDLASIEDSTTGYLRQPCSFAAAVAASPSSITNSNLMTYGPYTANQAAPVSWTALLAVPAQFTGGYAPLARTVQNGLLLYIWQVPNPQQVLATQNIAIAAGTFDIGIS